MRGLFITLEGAETSGKTTLGKKLYDYYQENNRKVMFLDEFSNSDVGTILQKNLSKDLFLREAWNARNAYYLTLLVIAENVYFYENKIKPALEEGYIIIKDRYIDSNIVYQIKCIQDEFPEKSHDELFRYFEKTLNEMVNQEFIIYPDITFVIETQIEKVQKRFLNREERTLTLEEHYFIEDIIHLYPYLQAYDFQNGRYQFINQEDIRDSIHMIIEDIEKKFGGIEVETTSY